MYIIILKASGKTELQEKIKFALPAFHAYGHKASCQVNVHVHLLIVIIIQDIEFKCIILLCDVHDFVDNFQVLLSPLRSEGFGLSDGEAMERLWSYLRRFSRMTKEMRPAHRIDVLTHALLYYGFSTKQKLGIFYYTIKG